MCMRAKDAATLDACACSSSRAASVLRGRQALPPSDVELAESATLPAVDAGVYAAVRAWNGVAERAVAYTGGVDAGRTLA